MAYRQLEMTGEQCRNARERLNWTRVDLLRRRTFPFGLLRPSRMARRRRTWRTSKNLKAAVGKVPSRDADLFFPGVPLVNLAPVRLENSHAHRAGPHSAQPCDFAFRVVTNATARG